MPPDPLALTAGEQNQIVAVLLLTGLASKDDVYRAANIRDREKRLRAFGTIALPQWVAATDSEMRERAHA